jgi:hypothetical protein
MWQNQHVNSTHSLKLEIHFLLNLIFKEMRNWYHQSIQFLKSIHVLIDSTTLSFLRLIKCSNHQSIT